jgi:hypothetical protein
MSGIVCCLRGVSKVLNDEQPKNKIPIAHSGCVENSFAPYSTKKYFVWVPVFLIFLEKSKKQAIKQNIFFDTFTKP